MQLSGVRASLVFKWIDALAQRVGCVTSPGDIARVSRNNQRHDLSQTLQAVTDNEGSGPLGPRMQLQTCVDQLTANGTLINDGNNKNS
jgi:hypothetical protein